MRDYWDGKDGGGGFSHMNNGGGGAGKGYKPSGFARRGGG